MNTVAVVPVFNEERTLDAVLATLAPHVDGMILVDDGSRDATPAILGRWQARRPGIWVVRHPVNRGMAQALKSGFFLADRLRERGEIPPEGIVVNLDADGQHPVGEIPLAAARMRAEDLDVLLVLRDFSLYPRYKVWGNRFLSRLARFVSGFPYRDVESGFRFLRARCLPLVLPYFTGWKYSCAQELAIITALQGLRIRNDHPVRINYYRPGTTFLDGFAVLVMSFVALARVRAGLRAAPGAREAHLAGVRVLPPPAAGGAA